MKVSKEGMNPLDDGKQENNILAKQQSGRFDLTKSQK